MDTTENVKSDRLLSNIEDATGFGHVVHDVYLRHPSLPLPPLNLDVGREGTRRSLPLRLLLHRHLVRHAPLRWRYSALKAYLCCRL